MELKVTTKKKPDFYVRSAHDFLTGNKNNDAVDGMVITGLGNAIPTAVHVAGSVQDDGKAKITKIETSYAGMNQKYGVAQIRVTVKNLLNNLPERLQDPKMEKILKKVQKEGGKRGVEIEGASDMGGLQFFCTNVLEPKGDLDLLVESMKAMNQKSDPSEEERKGGSGKIGKTIFSISEKDDKFAIVSYVPQELQSKILAKDWLEVVVKNLNVPTDGITTGPANCAKVEILQDGDKGIFPIKMKDVAITHALNHLKSKGLFPDKDEESDDDCVFGDEDFPA